MIARDKLNEFFMDNKHHEAEAFVATLPDSDAETWYLRGKVKSRLGNITAAISCYSKALEINSSFDEARAMLEMSKSILIFRDPNLYNH